MGSNEREAERPVRKLLQHPGRQDEGLNAGSDDGNGKESTTLRDVEENEDGNGRNKESRCFD